MPCHVVFMTGAGISADSGISTFRDAGGLWCGHRPEDVATPEGWARDPELVWRFYQARRAQLRDVAPNPAHAAVAELQQRLRDAGHGCTLVTQNVDDLHERAGAEALHMHGELAVLRCERCGHRTRDLEHVEPGFVPCARCRHTRLRPDVVWFGEMVHHIEEIDAALATCTHFVAIGTSGAVWPAAGMLHTARSRSAATIVQALEPPLNLDPRDRLVLGRAKDVVPALLDDLRRDILQY
jgi:NAD-dependent deacetylase